MKSNNFLSHRIVHRLPAFLLAAALAAPNSAGVFAEPRRSALREEPPAETTTLSGLEEALHGPTAGLEENLISEEIVPGEFSKLREFILRLEPGNRGPFDEKHYDFILWFAILKAYEKVLNDVERQRYLSKEPIPSNILERLDSAVPNDPYLKGVLLLGRSPPRELLGAILRHIAVNASDSVLERWGSHPGSLEIRIRALIRKGRLSIQVLDNGVGIPADVLEKLGKKRITSKRSSGFFDSKGQGVGVLCAYTIASQLGWEVTFANREDTQGAIVTIELPYFQKIPAGLEEWQEIVGDGSKPSDTVVKEGGVIQDPSNWARGRYRVYAAAEVITGLIILMHGENGETSSIKRRFLEGKRYLPPTQAGLEEEEIHFTHEPFRAVNLETKSLSSLGMSTVLPPLDPYEAAIVKAFSDPDTQLHVTSQEPSNIGSNPLFGPSNEERFSVSLTRNNVSRFVNFLTDLQAVHGGFDREAIHKLAKEWLVSGETPVQPRFFGWQVMASAFLLKILSHYSAENPLRPVGLVSIQNKNYETIPRRGLFNKPLVLVPKEGLSIRIDRGGLLMRVEKNEELRLEWRLSWSQRLQDRFLGIQVPVQKRQWRLVNVGQRMSRVLRKKRTFFVDGSSGSILDPEQVTRIYDTRKLGLDLVKIWIRGSSPSEPFWYLQIDCDSLDPSSRLYIEYPSLQKVSPNSGSSRVGLEELEVRWKAYFDAWHSTQTAPMMMSRLRYGSRIPAGGYPLSGVDVGKDRWEFVLALVRAGYNTREKALDEFLRRIAEHRLQISGDEKRWIEEAVQGALPAGLEEVSPLAVEKTVALSDRFVVGLPSSQANPELGIHSIEEPGIAQERARLEQLFDMGFQSVPLQMDLSLDPSLRLSLDVSEVWDWICGRRDFLEIRWISSPGWGSLIMGSPKRTLVKTSEPFLAAELKTADSKKVGFYTVGDEPVPEGAYWVAIRLIGTGEGETPDQLGIYLPSALLKTDGPLSLKALQASVILETIVEMARRTLRAQAGLSAEKAEDRAAVFRERLQHPDGLLGEVGLKEALGEIYGEGGFLNAQQRKWTHRLQRSGLAQPTEAAINSVLMHRPEQVVEFLRLLERIAVLYRKGVIQLADELKPYRAAVFNSMAGVFLKNRASGELAWVGTHRRKLIRYEAAAGESFYSPYSGRSSPPMIGISEGLLREDEAGRIDELQKRIRDRTQQMDIHRGWSQQEWNKLSWAIMRYDHLRAEHAHFLDYTLMRLLGISDNRLRDKLTEYQDFLEYVTLILVLKESEHDESLSVEALEEIRSSLTDSIQLCLASDKLGHVKSAEMLDRVTPVLMDRAAREGFSKNDLYQTFLWFKFLLLTARNPDQIETLLTVKSTTGGFLRDAEDYLRRRIGEAPKEGRRYLQGLLRELEWIRRHHARTGHFPPIGDATGLEELESRVLAVQQASSLSRLSPAGLEEGKRQSANPVVILGPSATALPRVREAVELLREAGLEERLIALPDAELPPGELDQRLVDVAARSFRVPNPVFIGYASSGDPVMERFREIVQRAHVPFEHRPLVSLRLIVSQILDDLGNPKGMPPELFFEWFVSLSGVEEAA